LELNDAANLNLCPYFSVILAFMDLEELNYYFNKFKFGEDNFHNLMRWRVRRILLISTFYDAYIFEHDAKLSEQIVGEYHQLNLTTVPRIVNVPNGEQAIRKLEEEQFDLVITTMRVGEISPFELSRRIKTRFPQMPILLLLTVKSDNALIYRNPERLAHIDNTFLWNGNSRLFLAMIKYVEDMRNVYYDTVNGFVRVILLIEDSITFSSMYLPILYTEIMEQTQRLIQDELNDSRKYHRMRTRPKVILARNFEEALELIDRFKEYLLGIISDIEYQRDGVQDTDAGFALLEYLEENQIKIPVLLQSSAKEKKGRADAHQVQFLHKRSPTMLNELRHFLLFSLGFGEFIFRMPSGIEAGRARTFKDFETAFLKAPTDSLVYHAKNDHFSAWLTAHGEFEVARRLKPVTVEDFESHDELRDFLTGVFNDVRRKRNRGKITDFSPEVLEQQDVVCRLGTGSLGGKGRGLAFLNALLSTTNMDKAFPGALIRIPRTLIIGTSEYDRFIEDNNLYDHHALYGDSEIQRQFMLGKLPDRLIHELVAVLGSIKKPLAIRSSGLLEDSQSQPFAGVYKTYMIPNNHPDLRVRLKQLTDAIKLVYSSVFLESTVQYIQTLNYGVEEEKMAVVIQEVVGSPNEDYYYPQFSGVAQSHNYYPIGSMENQDGVAILAAGLGQSVVGGGKDFMFCPKYPQIGYSLPEELLKRTQTDFFAINMKQDRIDLRNGEEASLVQLPIYKAEKHGTLRHLVSVWDNHSQMLRDGLDGQGPRVVNFANILKYEIFPLSKILQEILDMANMAMGVPVEIEFAVDLDKKPENSNLPTFYLLQVRPLTVNLDEIVSDLDELKKEDLFLFSKESLGNGFIDGIKDILYIDPEDFDKRETLAMEKELREYNESSPETGYALIGPGRWGSRDRFLGVPIEWAGINHARVIIEVGLPDFDIEPSQGSHFFHNLVAMNVGYFHIPNSGDSFIDWDWLRSQKIHDRKKYLRHIRLTQPLRIQMDGRKGNAVILFPEN
jgi:CheY-like chemotaxis protein